MKKGKWFIVAGLVVALVCVILIPMALAAGRGGARALTKVTFLHRHKHSPGSDTVAQGAASQGAYAFIAKGARWKSPARFVVNPTNRRNLSVRFVGVTMAQAAAEWGRHTGKVFDNVYIDWEAAYNDGKADGINSISFGRCWDPQIVAVTTVWGFFTGPQRSREIMEADVLFNEDYNWGDADAGEDFMDLLSVATHEMGHCAGLAYPSDLKGRVQTMYGRSAEGETLKRTLHDGDIDGIRRLYR